VIYAILSTCCSSPYGRSPKLLYEKFLRRVAVVFKDGIDRGMFKPLLDPYYMAVILESVTNAFLFLWFEDPTRHPYEENVRNVTELFFKNITNHEG